MISLKSFSAEEIFDLHLLSYPSMAVVLYRGRVLSPRAHLQYLQTFLVIKTGGMPPATKDYPIPKVNMLKLRNLILE